MEGSKVVASHPDHITDREKLNNYTWSRAGEVNSNSLAKEAPNNKGLDLARSLKMKIKSQVKSKVVRIRSIPSNSFSGIKCVPTPGQRSDLAVVKVPGSSEFIVPRAPRVSMTHAYRIVLRRPLYFDDVQVRRPE
ncbi:1-phosphatidylinositol-4-phosphate 5-kinases [Striga asiatica]|uniref:1-phosphatidylinositol-4-phosphate 5-kinases n=1 Tax=Striga asiatica TaxID=4170 RepID=A0A5A7QBZ9_STRAF|nr:1-phosphatidylinositol-4-phosphate 5-kinases [Striga asiatica]